MMTSRLFLAGLLGLAALASPMSVADTVADTPDASIQYVANKVGASLSRLSFVTDARPSASARYYAYLYSAGWCGPCNREMPHMNEAYKQMQESGLVEMVLFDYDHSEEQARDYVSRHGAAFPVTMGKAEAVQTVPGFKMPRGIPAAAIVDKDGNVVCEGHGVILYGWKSHITAYEQAKGLPLSFPESLSVVLSPQRVLAEVEAADDDVEMDDAPPGNSKAVANALTQIKFFAGKPSKKAQFYIYLQSASWCGPCCKEMPIIAKEYKAMKKDGRVELILLSGDRNLQAAKAFLRNYKAKFPGVMRGAKGVSELPCVGSLPNYFPAAVIVKADGTLLASGHGALVAEWRKYTVDAAGNEAEEAAE